MDTLWNRVRNNLVEWYGSAYEKTDELARISKKRIEMVGLNRSIEKHLAELGGRVYDILKSPGKNTVVRDTDVRNLVEKIESLEEELKLKEGEIETIKERDMEENENEGVDEGEQDI